ncbi:helix-turn-helix domain-containing protein [Clostridium sp. UBA1652]|uniref:helix-turn-helix domain-containing protein n=1 Tax=Clostridium sp. UBA1652 TaxID=1946348 RepID=UPI00257AB140|nr:helix-turn-helix transcriptional regulator [Clostridium sp. UBA1652]
MNTFGKRIKSLRQKKGLTQVELGKILNVTDLAVTKWESDASLPNTITLIKIADYFNVSIDYLLCRKYISYISSGNNVVKIHEKYPYNLSPEDVERLINQIKDVGFDIDKLIKNIKESNK